MDIDEPTSQQSTTPSQTNIFSPGHVVEVQKFSGLEKALVMQVDEKMHQQLLLLQYESEACGSEWVFASSCRLAAQQNNRLVIVTEEDLDLDSPQSPINRRLQASLKFG